MSFTQHVLRLHSESSKLVEKLQQRLHSLESRLCLHTICEGVQHRVLVIICHYDIRHSVCFDRAKHTITAV